MKRVIRFIFLCVLLFFLFRYFILDKELLKQDISIFGKIIENLGKEIKNNNGSIHIWNNERYLLKLNSFSAIFSNSEKSIHLNNPLVTIFRVKCCPI